MTEENSMDPRKAAKVTARDLVQAFEEGHGMSPAEINPADSAPRVYVVLVTEGEYHKQVFDLDQLTVAMAVVENHLRDGGDGHAAAIAVQVLPPEDWYSISDAQE